MLLECDHAIGSRVSGLAGKAAARGSIFGASQLPLTLVGRIVRAGDSMPARRRAHPCRWLRSSNDEAVAIESSRPPGIARCAHP